VVTELDDMEVTSDNTDDLEEAYTSSLQLDSIYPQASDVSENNPVMLSESAFNVFSSTRPPSTIPFDQEEAKQEEEEEEENELIAMDEEEEHGDSSKSFSFLASRPGNSIDAYSSTGSSKTRKFYGTTTAIEAFVPVVPPLHYVPHDVFAKQVSVIETPRLDDDIPLIEEDDDDDVDSDAESESDTEGMPASAYSRIYGITLTSPRSQEEIVVIDELEESVYETSDLQTSQQVEVAAASLNESQESILGLSPYRFTVTSPDGSLIEVKNKTSPISVRDPITRSHDHDDGSAGRSLSSDIIVELTEADAEPAYVPSVSEDAEEAIEYLEEEVLHVETSIAIQSQHAHKNLRGPSISSVSDDSQAIEERNNHIKDEEDVAAIAIDHDDDKCIGSIVPFVNSKKSQDHYDEETFDVDHDHNIIEDIVIDQDISDAVDAVLEAFPIDSDVHLDTERLEEGDRRHDDDEIADKQEDLSFPHDDAIAEEVDSLLKLYPIDQDSMDFDDPEDTAVEGIEATDEALVSQVTFTVNIDDDREEVEDEDDIESPPSEEMQSDEAELDDESEELVIDEQDVESDAAWSMEAGIDANERSVIDEDEEVLFSQHHYTEDLSTEANVEAIMDIAASSENAMAVDIHVHASAAEVRSDEVDMTWNAESELMMEEDYDSFADDLIQDHHIVTEEHELHAKSALHFDLVIVDQPVATLNQDVKIVVDELVSSVEVLYDVEVTIEVSMMLEDMVDSVDNQDSSISAEDLPDNGDVQEVHQEEMIDVDAQVEEADMIKVTTAASTFVVDIPMLDFSSIPNHSLNKVNLSELCSEDNSLAHDMSSKNYSYYSSSIYSSSSSMMMESSFSEKTEDFQVVKEQADDSSTSIHVPLPADVLDISASTEESMEMEDVDATEHMINMATYEENAAAPVEKEDPQNQDSSFLQSMTMEDVDVPEHPTTIATGEAVTPLENENVETMLPLDQDSSMQPSSLPIALDHDDVMAQYDDLLETNHTQLYDNTSSTETLFSKSETSVSIIVMDEPEPTGTALNMTVDDLEDILLHGIQGKQDLVHRGESWRLETIAEEEEVEESYDGFFRDEFEALDVAASADTTTISLESINANIIIRERATTIDGGISFSSDPYETKIKRRSSFSADPVMAYTLIKDLPAADDGSPAKSSIVEEIEHFEHYEEDVNDDGFPDNASSVIDMVFDDSFADDLISLVDEDEEVHHEDEVKVDDAYGNQSEVPIEELSSHHGSITIDADKVDVEDCDSDIILPSPVDTEVEVAAQDMSPVTSTNHSEEWNFGTALAAETDDPAIGTEDERKMIEEVQLIAVDDDDAMKRGCNCKVS
jgi:hypothetical protein